MLIQRCESDEVIYVGHRYNAYVLSYRVRYKNVILAYLYVSNAYLKPNNVKSTIYYNISPYFIFVSYQQQVFSQKRDFTKILTLKAPITADDIQKKFSLVFREKKT